MVALNQLDPNDKLIFDGLDAIIRAHSSINTVDGAILDLAGTIYVNGVPFGSGGSGETGYIHTQGAAATTWTINHNLGRKPIVQVFNAGSIRIEAEIEDVTNNQTIVRLSPATSGFARLI